MDYHVNLCTEVWIKMVEVQKSDMIIWVMIETLLTFLFTLRIAFRAFKTILRSLPQENVEK